MNLNLPEIMKALVVESYNSNLVRALAGVKMMEIPVPVVFDGQVLIKVDAAPVNPSDIAFLRGSYNITKTLPAVPGFEGAGRIVAVGEDVDETLAGKMVCFFTQDENVGSWAEYVVANVANTLVLNDNISVQQAACMFVNPLTAYALFEHAFENDHEAMILTGAGGQVSQFIRFFAKERGIKIINLVRKEQHIAALKNEGEDFVLNLSDNGFSEQLANIARQLNATIAFDAVGGEITGKLMNAMPEGSEIMLYGGLSGQLVSGIDALGIIFKNKILGGFNLGAWLEDIPRDELMVISQYLQSLILENKITTKIQNIFPLDDFYNGLRSYISNMSGGKVLLKM